VAEGLVELIPGAVGRVAIAGAAHFLQEDAPNELADTVLGFLER
jgi:pimeloyl-ACP methyl ester carboxylesterase